MRRVLLGALGAMACTARSVPAPAAMTEPQRWAGFAERVTIVRDDWGVAHVRGRSDADAVFGMMYAQAEDDFPRIEANYLTALGRVAEAEGEAAIWQDLRMKLFIDPEALRAQYAASPGWLRALMDAWADGLNYFLATHAEVKPRVITRFEPWMALSFTEGSIGGDVERVDLAALEAFYRAAPPTPAGAAAPVARPGLRANGAMGAQATSGRAGTTTARAEATARRASGRPQGARRRIRSPSRRGPTGSRSRRGGRPAGTRCSSSTRTPRSSFAPSCR